ncbi:phospholipid carrier-dependent glycosyltransferase [Paenibacillus sp. WLX2291]|uniref:phospholipid carrier-dependent glycosyltransferase n=1 Tax=Paenibacillus sp. WLX2291 TaxID=3296934 RepID=UPI003983E4F0
MKLLKIDMNFYQCFVVIVSGIVFSVWAYHIPFNNAPDELMRYQIPQFIFNHGKLPTGYDPEVIYWLGNWSYAFYPQFLGSIFSALFMGIMSIIKNSDHALLFAARLTSVLFGMIAILFTGKSIELITKSKKFSILGMVFMAFLPQFTFLSSYVNNDIIAVSGASIVVFSMIKAYQNQWNIKNSICLALGFIICGLGYSNSYGFILMGGLFFIISNILNFKMNRTTLKQIITNFSVVFILTAVVTFPFFIRNYMLYSDFLGMNTFRKEYLRWLAEGGQVLQQPYKGDLFKLLFDNQARETVIHSFIGQFGYMNVIMSESYYDFYLYLGIVGVISVIFNYICKIFKKIYVWKKTCYL